MPKEPKKLDELFHDSLKDIYSLEENSYCVAKNAKGGFLQPTCGGV